MLRTYMIVLLAFAALSFLPCDAAAQSMPAALAEADESVKDNVIPPPDITEYDNIPDGLLLSTQKAPAAAIDTTLSTPLGDAAGLYKIPGTDRPVEEKSDRTLTIEEIYSKYKKGEYAEILTPIKAMAEFSSHEAEELLGIMYLYGQGVPKDTVAAFDFLTKAAEAGLPLAEHHLGVMYFMGQKPAEKDEIRALMWLHLAILHYEDGAEKERAKQDRDGVYLKLSRYDKQQAMEMVREWLERKGELHLLDLQ